MVKHGFGNRFLINVLIVSKCTTIAVTAAAAAIIDVVEFGTCVHVRPSLFSNRDVLAYFISTF